MDYISWIQGAVGLVSMLAWLILWKKKRLLSKHYFKKEDKSLLLEWDPKARKKLLSSLFFGGLLNLVSALVSFFLHDSLKLTIFFVGIISLMALVFVISYFAEKDNLNRLDDRK